MNERVYQNTMMISFIFVCSLKMISHRLNLYFTRLPIMFDSNSIPFRSEPFDGQYEWRSTI